MDLCVYVHVEHASGRPKLVRSCLLFDSCKLTCKRRGDGGSRQSCKLILTCMRGGGISVGIRMQVITELGLGPGPGDWTPGLGPGPGAWAAS